MHFRTRTVASIAVASAAAITASTGAVALAASSSATRTAAAAAVPVVTVHMSDSAIKLSGGGTTTSNGSTTVHAGRITFRVVTGAGDHVLQIMRFRHGYTAQDAQQDIPKAFSGDTDAIKRVDDGISFRGGAEAKPQHPGRMVVTLSKGEYFLVDQNGNAGAVLEVTGSVPARATVPHQGTYTAFTYGWDVTKNLPAKGVVRVHNQADQPHFLEIQHIKESTTKRQVRKVMSPNYKGGQPSWALKGTAQSGVISPTKSQLLKYDLPAGKYVIACFWPDLNSGMPHAFMGMWKIVHLS
ncbi:MAG TPA: hypothetical protein VFT62_10790 [Mycobacteriales bacterium]|nr:hypothetical protein [Mycobacteriales bacterium]